MKPSYIKILRCILSFQRLHLKAPICAFCLKYMASFVQGNAKSSKFLNRGILWLEIKVNKNANERSTTI